MERKGEGIRKPAKDRATATGPLNGRQCHCVRGCDLKVRVAGLVYHCSDPTWRLVPLGAFPLSH